MDVSLNYTAKLPLKKICMWGLIRAKCCGDHNECSKPLTARSQESIGQTPN
jgi:hypothetical protein